MSTPSAAKRRKASPTADLPGTTLSATSTTSLLEPQAPDSIFRSRNGLRRTPPQSSVLGARRSAASPLSSLPRKTSLAVASPTPAMSASRREETPVGENGSAVRDMADLVSKRSGIDLSSPNLGAAPLREEASALFEAATASIAVVRSAATLTQTQPPITFDTTPAMRDDSSTLERSLRRSAGVSGTSLALSPARRARVGSQTPRDVIKVAELAGDGSSMAEQVQRPHRRSPRLSQPPPAGSGVRTDAPNVREKEDDEPELPPTPTQLGIPDPVMSKLPLGLINSPGRRGKRKRRSVIRDEIIGSSPLRRTLQVQGSPERHVGRAAVLTSPRPRLTDEEREEQRMLAEKRQIRDNLQKELRELQSDVTKRERALIRIQDLEARDLEEDGLSADDIIALLLDPNDSHAPEPSKRASTSLSSTISSFLPFAFHPPPPDASTADTNSESPFPSHLPIALDDPLPYLQVFTPLTLTSTSTLSIPAAPSLATGSIIQTHTIHATTPSDILTATFTFSVSLLPTPAIISLHMTHLSPWVEPELGTWLRKYVVSPHPVASPTATSTPSPLPSSSQTHHTPHIPQPAFNPSLLQNDITLALVSVGRYHDIALQRARFLHHCQQAYPSLLPTRSATSPSSPSQSSRNHPHHHYLTQSTLLLQPQVTQPPDPTASPPTPTPSLLLTWRIHPTPTGEPTSTITLLPGAWPHSYRATDHRARLQTISDIFQSILHRYDPASAPYHRSKTRKQRNRKGKGKQKQAQKPRPGAGPEDVVENVDEVEDEGTVEEVAGDHPAKDDQDAAMDGELELELERGVASVDGDGNEDEYHGVRVATRVVVGLVFPWAVV